MATEKMFQIRRPDGLYSRGGSWPRFNKVGKVWTKLGGLKNHITMVNQMFDRENLRDQYPYTHCDIVTIEIKREELACTPVIDYHLMKN